MANNLRRVLGALLFFGSFVIYGAVFYVAASGELRISERAALASILYGVSWGAFALGSLLLGPEFLESIKKFIKLDSRPSKKD
tara:strand:- start:527 stop:775 length:249 start_codon:yes stop_codon:yes gene_type:complete